MNIRHNIVAVATLALACGLSSCDKFLDITPVGKVIPTTLQDYRDLLNKAYDYKISDKGYTELRTDIADVRNEANDISSMGDIETWVDISAKTSTRQFSWATYYTSLYYANAIIQKASSIEGGTQAERDQLLGEAYMYRAMTNFTLVNLYGQPYTKSGAPETLSVPLKLDTDLEDALGRATVGAVYASIHSDLNSARRMINLDTVPMVERYRFTKPSVDALEARVALYQGDWTLALAASERVLSAKSTLEDLNDAKAMLPNLYNSAETISAFEQNINSDVGRAIRAPKDFYDSFASGDKRKSMFFGNQVANETYYDIKKVDGNLNQRNSFRTAEFYLTSAEAATRLGDLAKAKERLLQLLIKRYDSASYTALQSSINAMGADALLSLVLDERKKELCYEGHRWFDLRRTTRPALTKTVRGVTYTLSADDSRYTLRIPQEAIDNNPNLITR